MNRVSRGSVEPPGKPGQKLRLLKNRGGNVEHLEAVLAVAEEQQVPVHAKSGGTAHGIGPQQAGTGRIRMSMT